MYHEVTMIEVREVLRLRGEGLPKKQIATQLALDPKTVRRYLVAAATADVRVTATGDGWARCLEQRAMIEWWLGDGIRLTKIRKLLVRQVEIAYSTLHRFAVLELQFGKTPTTIPVLDGEPGPGVEIDTGWVGWLTFRSTIWNRFNVSVRLSPSAAMVSRRPRRSPSLS